MTLDYKELNKKLSIIKPYFNSKYLLHNKRIESIDVNYTYHSNAIEGNTLTLKETATVLDGKSVANKSIVEIHEALNHSKAFNYIMKYVGKIDKIISEEDIKYLHSIILNNIDEYYAGVYREINVGIKGTNTVFPEPQEVKKLMIEFANNLVEEQKIAVKNPVELASEAHYNLVNIHPFVDGNGRTARLLMNFILVKDYYPPIIVKVEDRNDYIKAIENGKDTFKKFIYNQATKVLDEYIKEVNCIKKVQQNKE